MDLQKSIAYHKSTYVFFLISGILFAAFNLRPAITSVGPIVGMIQEDLHLSHFTAGLLTSLPLAAFAVVSPVVPIISNRFGNERTILFGLVLLVIGIFSRSVTSVFFLFTGTLLIGVGIAISNVLLPVIVKEKFPLKVGLMTSVYSTAMGIFAAVASGVSIPIASDFGYGWETALIVWVIPAIIAVFIWGYLSRFHGERNVQVKKTDRANGQIWRSSLAWQVALFTGFQSFLFYVTVTWLPEILHHHGLDLGTAGWLLSLSQFVGLPASFFVPMIAAKFRSQSVFVVILSIFSLIGYGGLLLPATYPMLVLYISLIGFALNGSFALALSFMGMRARDARESAELSGMAQSFGYILAAIGPIFIGYLFDVTGSWTWPLVTLLIVNGLVMIFGAGSGRNQFV
ncbi:CynX/NimT family MFS transporter [Fervidibacillus albus]|uniref:MFS transporter n=1 Tax=Fervidibacillus albus TaxID=2980026 RepID=A0A9E8LUL4_9BACI|nr:MFS transporter [Fervidibacillus albus]WAA09801.1 MFS transporter [Fervidibacillus albus]